MRLRIVLLSEKLSRYSLNTLECIKLLLLPCRAVPSKRDWDAGRLGNGGIGVSGIRPHLPSEAKVCSSEDRILAADVTKDSREALDEVVSTMHWISLVCFLEGLDPDGLLLSDDLSLRIEGELARLGGCSALDVYAAGLAAVL